MRRSTILVLIVLVMLPFFTLGPPHLVHGQLSVSTVYVDESNAPLDAAIGGSVTVAVKLDLAAGQSISGFDVRLNYTGFNTVLTARSLDISGNLLATSGYAPYPLALCLGDIAVNSTTCDVTDSPTGQVQVAEAFGVSASISGPLSGVLFRTTFGVKGNGTSLLTFDRANILNPGASLPPNPHYIPLMVKGGVFGNSGIATFFNFQTSNPTLSPALLPTVAVNFDASLSFDANVTTLTATKYSWNFGDGTGLTNTTSSLTIHTFRLAGTYQVSLTVYFGSPSASITRGTVVVPALGALSLTVKGNTVPLPGSVVVKIFNSSSSSVPFGSVSTGASGNVSYDNLTPGNYFVEFSGDGIVGASRTESVGPGYTTTDWVYLDVVPPPPNYGGIIFVGGLLVAVSLFGALIFVRWRRAQNVQRKKRLKGLKDKRQ